ncbi:MAG: hypothetical protein PHR26_00575 [Candidatus ainarchaeum sp.]|nr:hypothetical protein [Candidatus ainarchaeum sp.]MDD3975783.1 hypothetical protein [Candidatus ainarchaeum sp.]
MCLFKKKGKIDIKLDSYNLKYDDFIKGKLFININKDLIGKELYIKLISYKYVKEYDSNGKAYKNKKILFNFKQSLDSLKNYSKTISPLEYSFKIKIPSKNSIDPLNSTKVGNIINKISIFTGNNSKLYWDLESKLVVKKSLFNIKKKIDLNIN